jgi:hypothetical protein
MRVRIRSTLALLLAGAVICSGAALAQQAPRVANLPNQTPTGQPAAQEATPKFTFILFWKENNAATQAMMAQLKTSLPQKQQQTDWSAVNVTDPANKDVVERYKVSRAPMPMVMCVASNGAITGAVPDRINDQTIDKLLVTPTMTHCMKALQENKIVLVHVKADSKAVFPQGPANFANDPEFKVRTVAVSFDRNDPSEARFLRDMQIDAKTPGSVVSMLAPPGVLVGKYTENATKDQIAADLHAAGKCCDDPNCKHNQQGKK